MDKHLLVLFAAVIIATPACRSTRQAEETSERESAGSAKRGEALVLDSTLIEQLSAIGFVSGTSPAGPLKGVTVYKEALAQKGYSFFTSRHAPAAFLMDMEAKILHEWRAEFSEIWPNHPEAPQGPSAKQNLVASRRTPPKRRYHRDLGNVQHLQAQQRLEGPWGESQPSAYRGPQSAPLASRSSSGVEVLENGNILITETNKGRVLEITPKGEIVWEFHNPFETGAKPALIAHVYHIDRVEPSRVSWLSTPTH